MSDKALLEAIGFAMLDNKVPEWRHDFICSVQDDFDAFGLSERQRIALEEILEAANGE